MVSPGRVDTTLPSTKGRTMTPIPESNDQDPLVSVIVPAFRTAHTLKAAVDSILHQTLQDFEIILIEDCSGDDTLRVAEELAASDARITLVALERNGGQAHALNTGIARARGSWVATLDADDVYLPDRLAALVECGEREGVDMVADNQRHVDGTAGVLVRTAFPPADGGRQLTLQDFVQNNSTQSSFSLGILKPMIRRSFIVRHGLGYHEGLKLAQDFYHLMQFFAAGGRGWLTSRPYYVWTLPFGPVSRAWTTTGLGAWRYDYSGTIEANRHFMDLMEKAGQPELVALLRRREREYRTMMHYISAQKTFAETGRVTDAARIIVAHPSTWTLLARRTLGRVTRKIASA